LRPRQSMNTGIMLTDGKIQGSQIGRQIINPLSARSCGIGIWVPGHGLVANRFIFTGFNGFLPGLT